MLTDTKLRHLKPKEKLCNNGLYVAITPAGTISFRFNYSINGRQETVVLDAIANGAAEYQTMKRSSGFSRVQRTIGGELATQIRKQTASRRDNREHDDFVGDSLSGNNKS